LNRRIDAIASSRRAALAARRALDSRTRDALSLRISQRISRMHEFMACQHVACYLSAADEVNPSLIIQRAWRARKQVFAPAVRQNGTMEFRQLTPKTELCKNRYGLWEPQSDIAIAPQRLDLVITPVVAFDTRRHRIGMGSGYFDRCFAFLKHHRQWQRPKLIGVAFECQRVEKIVPNPWDIRLYRLITERRSSQP
jgi:5-formyltetrahydrofolate cyclo-ligase